MQKRPQYAQKMIRRGIPEKRARVNDQKRKFTSPAEFSQAAPFLYRRNVGCFPGGTSGAEKTEQELVYVSKSELISRSSGFNKVARP